MWTPTELASEFRPYAGRVYRVVEAQHRISMNRLAASAEDQAVLEDLAEAVKPTLPASAQHLDYLLAAPFRYGHAQGSRFRRAHERPGIFYASEHEETAIAETAYWQLRFYARSPGFSPPSATVEHTSFSVAVETVRALDLTTPPFDRTKADWMNATDYTACQDMAASARVAAATLIRTESVRDEAHRCNVAILDPVAFAETRPAFGKTWHFRFENGRLTAFAAFPAQERYTFV
jgi:hypothetical protein